MIVHLPPWGSNEVAPVIRDRQLAVSAYPNRERSENSLRNRIGVAPGRVVVDFEWHSPNDAENNWVVTWLGQRRDLRARTADRRSAFEIIAGLAPPSPVLSPGGRPDQLFDSCRYAGEMIQVTDRPVWATMAINRQSLRDPAVLMGFNGLPQKVDGLYIVVVDNAGYPSAWSADELTAYLELVGSHALSGRSVIVAHADLRGLMAVAVGATHLGIGLSKGMRQYGTREGGGGGRPGVGPPPTEAYTSLPLMGVLHGTRARTILTDAEQRAVESHARCLAGARLDLGEPTGIFAENWAFGAGNANLRRSLDSLLSVGAVERALLSLYDPDDDQRVNIARRADRLQAWLDDAAALAVLLDQEVFQTAGTKREIRERPAVFAAVRQRLGI